MVSAYPRKTATAIAESGRLLPEDHDAMVDVANGRLLSGVTLDAPYKYLIRINGGQYEALDANGNLTYGGSGDEGGVDGDDCAAVLLACIHALGTVGGEIRFKQGTYSFTSQIAVDTDNYRNWCISGEEYNMAYSGLYDAPTVLLKTFSGDFFDIYSTLGSTPAHPWKLKNLIIQGMTQAQFNGAGILTGRGLYIHNAGWWEIRNVRVSLFESHIIEVNGSGHSKMLDVEADTTKNGHGIYLHDTVADSIYFNVSSNCVVQPVGTAALYSTSAVTFIGCHFEGFYGAYITASCNFIGCTFPFAESNNAKISGAGADPKFSNCSFQGANDSNTYAGEDSAQISIADGCYPTFTNCHIGDSANSDYSIYGRSRITLLGCLLDSIYMTSRCAIIGCSYIGSVTSASNNILIGNTFVSPATITASVGANYMRGNYNVADFVWIEDTTPGLGDASVGATHEYPLATAAGWSSAVTGSGGFAMYPLILDVYTGATGSSTSRGSLLLYHLSQDANYQYTNFNEQIKLHFTINRHGTENANHIARVQIKKVTTEGVLADIGMGIEILNLTVNGEAYGAGGRDTVALGSLTNGTTTRFMIDLIPGESVDFYVDDALVDSITGTSVPSGGEVCYLVVTAINGAGAADLALSLGGVKVSVSY